MTKIISLIMSLLMFIFPFLNIPEADVEKENFKNEYTNVLVHGYAGWGDYDWYNGLLPYWGMNYGDLTKYLSARGFDCVAASVAPTSSAWDRACELYAELTGTVTDYGKVHSENCGHKRYGKDYSKKRLIASWSEEDKINLFGHSFGGATVRMLAHLLKNGSAEERAAGEASTLFEGGKGGWIHAVVTLSAPHNGTSSYDIQQVISNDPNATATERAIAKTIMGISDVTNNGKVQSDTAIYEMQIDNAMEMNENIETLENVYYFSYACNGTTVDENGNCVPDERLLPNVMYTTCANRICSFTGVTPKGYVIDEKWQANDGLINTYSALCPLGAPSKDFDRDNIEPGIWNVMPVQQGNHSTLQGAMTDYFNGRLFFIDLISMLNSLG